MSDDDTGELASLAMHTGYVMGALRRPECRKVLTARGLKMDDCEAAFKALAKVAETFYRGGVD